LLLLNIDDGFDDGSFFLYIYNEKEVGTYKSEFLDFLEQEKLPPSVETPKFNSVILDYKKKFYDSEEITPNFEDQNFKYIDNMVTGLIKEEYIPRYEITGKKEEIITWEAEAKG